MATTRQVVQYVSVGGAQWSETAFDITGRVNAKGHIFPCHLLRFWSLKANKFYHHVPISIFLVAFILIISTKWTAMLQNAGKNALQSPFKSHPWFLIRVKTTWHGSSQKPSLLKKKEPRMCHQTVENTVRMRKVVLEAFRWKTCIRWDTYPVCLRIRRNVFLMGSTVLTVCRICCCNRCNSFDVPSAIYTTCYRSHIHFLFKLNRRLQILLLWRTLYD